jgi:dolichyl-phosphate-mannose-protein mannosyltransferase
VAAAPRWTDRQIVAAALVAWFAVGMLALASGPPLGHDEAAYAVAARGDAPAWAYRSTGMIAIARVGLALGGSELALRAVALVLGAGVLVGAFALGTAAFDRRTGAWAAAVLATAHPMAIRSAELIGDLPATACLLGGVALLIGELERERARWRLVWAAPLFAAAFYIRYGSAPVIAMIAVLAIVFYARRLACLPVLATAVVAALLVVPHVAHSIETTGSPLGILTASASMPRRAYVGEGLVTYVTSNPFRFYGALVAPVMIAGLVALRTRRRAPWFVVLLALGQFVSLGIESHAQPRYVFFATALLVVAGVDVIRRLDRPRLAVAACALAWLGLAIAIVPFQHYLAELRRPLYATATAVRDDAAGRPCAIAANVAPQLIWATHCDVIIAKTAPSLREPWPPDARVKYVVSAPHAVVSAIQLQAVAATAHAVPHELAVASPGSPEARAWRLDP